MRWYCKYGISYRELAEMLFERGVKVDHTTNYRWVQRYGSRGREAAAPLLAQPEISCSWHIGKTYVKMAGKWAYLYRSIDQHWHMIDFHLSDRRNAAAAIGNVYYDEIWTVSVQQAIAPVLVAQ